MYKFNFFFVIAIFSLLMIASTSKVNINELLQIKPADFKTVVYENQFSDRLTLKGPSFEKWAIAEEKSNAKDYKGAFSNYIEFAQVKPQLKFLALYKASLTLQKLNDSNYVPFLDSIIKLKPNDFWKNRFWKIKGEMMLNQTNTASKLDSAWKFLSLNAFNEVNKNTRDAFLRVYKEKQSIVYPESTLIRIYLAQLDSVKDPKKAPTKLIDFMLSHKKAKKQMKSPHWYVASWNLLARGVLPAAEDAADEVDWDDYKKTKLNKNQFWAEWKWQDKDYKKSLSYFLKSFETHPEPEELYLQIARCYKNINKKTESDSVYALYRSKFPSSSKTAEMYWTMAQDFEQNNQKDSALWAYAQFDSKLSKDKRMPWIGLKIGLVYFKDNLWETAIKEFKKVPEESNKDIRGAAEFYIAQSFLKLNQKDSAKIYFSKSIQSFPLGWYGHRSRQELENNNLLNKDLIPNIKPLEYNLRNTLTWARQKQDKDEVLGWSEEIQNTIELLLISQNSQMAWELFQTDLVHHMKSIEYLIFYSKLFFDLGEYHRSYSIARQAQQLLPTSEIPKAPRPFLELIFPFPFREIAMDLTQKDTLLDPHLLPAVARQESTFDPNIASPVGALGFMQFMPATGKNIANKLKIPNFQTENLKNPIVAYTLGAQYLRDLLEEYKQPEWVLANYNAGPEPAKRWKKNGQDKLIDVAVEDISFWETRDYVKKCMANYWTYSVLYPR